MGFWGGPGKGTEGWFLRDSGDLQGKQEPEQSQKAAWHTPMGGIWGLDDPFMPGGEVIPQPLGVCHLQPVLPGWQEGTGLTWGAGVGH